MYGLSISLLERLYDLYYKLGDVAKPYCAHLCTNFRCHQQILNLAHQVAYKMPLECKVPDHSAHPDTEFKQSVSHLSLILLQISGEFVVIRKYIHVYVYFMLCCLPMLYIYIYIM